MDRGACKATVHGIAKVGHYLELFFFLSFLLPDNSQQILNHIKFPFE